VHWFSRWALRAQRACLFVKVQYGSSSASSAAVWFGSAHLQHDITAYENGAQLSELRDAIATLDSDQVVCGIDANIVGWRLVHAAYSAGLVEHCGVEHPSTFPAVRPLYRLDGLLTAANKSVHVEVSADDMALSAIGSWDPETEEHASDHMPVVGTLFLR